MTYQSRSHQPSRISSGAMALMLVMLPTVAVAQSGRSDVVYTQVSGMFDASSRRHIERALADASSAGASAVLIDLDVRGGSMLDAQLIVGSIIESPVRVFAYVNPSAWGAGALVALAADSTFMAGEGSMGWGDVSGGEAELSPAAVRELRSEFQVLAMRKGLDGQVAMAMVDPDIAIEGIVKGGELLTLSAERAAQLGFVVGNADSVNDVLDILGFADAEVGVYTQNQLASGITITVDNNNWRDVRVTVEFGASGSIRRNLGTVTSMNSTEFEIPLNMVTVGSRVRGVVEVIGSYERTATDWVTAQSGLAIDWVIANVISQSNYFAYIKY